MDVWPASYLIGNIQRLDNSVHMVIGEEVSLLDEPICWSGVGVSWSSGWHKYIGVGWKDLRCQWKQCVLFEQIEYLKIDVGGVMARTIAIPSLHLSWKCRRYDF